MFFQPRAGERWVDRGDINAVDYNVGTLTADGAWYDLDISGIVGIGIKLILIQATLNDNAGGNGLKIRPKGYTNEVNIPECHTQVANKVCHHNFWVQTDVNGIIQYKIDAATWATINLVIRGVFK